MSLTSFIRAHFEFSDIFHRSALKINVTLTLSEEIRESFTYFLEIVLQPKSSKFINDLWKLHHRKKIFENFRKLISQEQNIRILISSAYWLYFNDLSNDSFIIFMINLIKHFLSLRTYLLFSMSNTIYEFLPTAWWLKSIKNFIFLGTYVQVKRKRNNLQHIWLDLILR